MSIINTNNERNALSRGVCIMVLVIFGAFFCLITSEVFHGSCWAGSSNPLSAFESSAFGLSDESMDENHSRELSIFQALEMGLSNNFDIAIEGLNSSVARENIIKLSSERGPKFNMELSTNYLDKLQNSIDFASSSGIRNWEEKNWGVNSGVEFRTIQGTRYSLDYTVISRNNSLNRQAPSLNALFNPEVETFMGLNVVQPLMKNSGKAVNLAAERIARIEVGLSDFRRRILVNNKALEIISACYDLSFANQNVSLREQALEVAQRFLKLSKRRQELGKGDSADVDQAGIQISEAREKLLLARDYQRRRNTALLHEIMGSVTPETRLPDFRIPELDCPELPSGTAEIHIGEALKNRPDYLMTLDQARVESIRRSYAGKQRLPELNISMSYGFHGIGNSHSRSFDVLNDWDEPEWSAALSYQTPLDGFRGERSEMAIRDIRKQQALLNSDRMASRIAIEIHDALERIRLLSERYKVTLQSRELSQKAMDVEEKRYLNGRTSSFAVLELQDKVFNARTRELSARLDLARALEEFRAARGVLLRDRGFLLKGEVMDAVDETEAGDFRQIRSDSQGDASESSDRLNEIRKRLEEFRSRS
ncbi:MAG: hypothetical protein CVV64_12610 [Candidatus Wallbacteria bacterium HGW-Wallbacteria-1]|jgi:outer membrane protein TolC|uniref:TolC family protein n=1 Tax=Candidatus Wallbacteria bacterium HGW-Wallbacteria-1 TaxID=2013854 RepID=A0A2N1PN42_9BACT|nr:MAG: hypothetical protein CVV64_12610 [Candidatus Wallbacteria bacterium HGW-Wallbacteria-1]